MPMTRNAMASRKGKVVANEGMSRVPMSIEGQSKAPRGNTTPSHSSPILSAPEEMRRNPVPPPIVQDEDMDMWSAVQLLTRLVAAQAQRQVGTSVGHINRVISARVRDFINLDPPVFTGSNKDEDPQNFIYRMQRTLRVMHASNTESVELASYRLRDVAVQWYETWESSKGTNASPAGQRKKARSARRPEDFSSDPMSPYPVESVQQLQKSYYEGSVYSESGQGSRILGFQNRRDSVQMRAPPPRCSQCGRAHSGQCRQGYNVCYTCEDPSHYMRDCPINGKSGMVQLTRSITVSSSSVRPQERGPQASVGRGRGRGGASSSGGSQNRIYALAGHQDPEATPDDVSGIVIIGNV
uniref:Uncharacterized protein LOC104245878 n=2 Tax=Nicotiana sylvestris TaxID=4096 RepID=A0A1U7Y9U7_NICSY|nr:PREDICTED: uncharacterized protein LOC104245878 [Nicotiana sylvestris]